MSKLEIINRFLVQFFFIRICKSVQKDKIRYGVLYFVIPFTGWNKEYISLGKIKYKLFDI